MLLLGCGSLSGMNMNTINVLIKRPADVYFFTRVLLWDPAKEDGESWCGGLERLVGSLLLARGAHVPPESPATGLSPLSKEAITCTEPWKTSEEEEQMR